MRILADGRVRRTETEWRAVMERFEKSGLSLSAFCRRSKLSRSSFLQWRRRLSGIPCPTPGFVEWVAPTSEVPEAVERGGAGEFELSLPGGVVLRWRA